MTTNTMDTVSLARPRSPEYNTPQLQLSMKADGVPNPLHSFLKRVPLLAGLTDAEVESLAKDFVPRRFRQGETIFHEGDAGQLLYLIESGRVRIYVMGEDGQETSVSLAGSGDIFGELAVIDGLPRSASVVAQEDTQVLTLSRERLREHLRRSPQLEINFMKTLSVRVRYSTQQMGSLTFLDVSGRLARKLLELAQAYGVAEPEGVRIDTTLTQSDLASLIGATRESINKAMSALRRQGLVLLRHGSIIIVDPDALREIGS